MGGVLQALIFTLIGVLLLWFGFTLFFVVPGGLRIPFFRKRDRAPKSKSVGIPGMPRTCPVCSVKLEPGERVKSAAFPSMGGADRLMYISGCRYCVEGDRIRVCPVCGTILRDEEFLIARLFEKPGRSHVHVLGCTQCKLRHL